MIARDEKRELKAHEEQRNSDEMEIKPCGKESAVSEEETLTLRLYSPLRARYEEDGWSESVEMNGGDLTEFAQEIKTKLESQIKKLEPERGLAAFLDKDSQISDKVISAFPDVEVYDGVLCGVLECRLKELLNHIEIGFLFDYWRAQESDGWGEAFEQQEIKTAEGFLYVSFWDGSQDQKILTETEFKGTDEMKEESGMAMNFLL